MSINIELSRGVCGLVGSLHPKTTINTPRDTSRACKSGALALVDSGLHRCGAGIGMVAAPLRLARVEQICVQKCCTVAVSDAAAIVAARSESGGVIV